MRTMKPRRVGGTGVVAVIPALAGIHNSGNRNLASHLTPQPEMVLQFH